MIATDFTRDDCQLGGRRVSYAKLQREYRCRECEGRLVERFGSAMNEVEGWHVECAQCGGLDFVHEAYLAQSLAEAQEVLEGLPPELATLIEQEGAEQ